MHEDILDIKRKEALPTIAEVSSGFYLAGGTALALQIGHRDSIDFDFFIGEEFDTEKVFEKCTHAFGVEKVRKLQEETNTLTVLVHEEIQLSFFTYSYPLLHATKSWQGISVASIEDIATMKLSAIVSRATQKDYIDLYFILHNYPLPDLLEAASKKLSTFNETLALKSLVYFEDVEVDPIRYAPGKEVSWEDVKNFLIQTVKTYKNK